MARMVFPDEGSRLVFRAASTGNNLQSATGAIATVYTSEAATTLADIQTTAGVAISGAQLVVDQYSRLPLFLGPDGVDTVWVRVDGGPATPVYARSDDRIDAKIDTAVASGTYGALSGGQAAPKIASTDRDIVVQMGGAVDGNLSTNAMAVQHLATGGVSAIRFLSDAGREKCAVGYGNTGVSTTTPFSDSAYFETSNFINADGTEDKTRPTVPLRFVTTGVLSGFNPAVGAQSTNWDFHLRQSIDGDASIRFYKSGPNFGARDPMVRFEGLSGRVGIGFEAADPDLAGGGGAASPAGELDVFGRAIFGKSATAKHTDRQNVLAGNSAAVINDTAGLMAFSRWAVGRFDFAIPNDTDANGQGGPRFNLNDKTGNKDGVLQVSLDGKRNVGINGFNFGGGQGVLNIQDAVAVPISSFGGGGQLYAEAGALKWRGSAGTVTTIAVA